MIATCRYNHMVECESGRTRKEPSECRRCGWNPIEHERRCALIEQFYKDYRYCKLNRRH